MKQNTPDSPLVFRAAHVCRPVVLVCVALLTVAWLTIGSRDLNVALSALLLPIATLYLVHWNGRITLSPKCIGLDRACELGNIGRSAHVDIDWKDVSSVLLESDFFWSNLYVSSGKKTYLVETGFYFFSKKGAARLEQALEDYRHRLCQTTVASESSVLIRGVMLVCVVLFGYLSWFHWCNMFETRQWPSDSNGWFNLLLSPALAGLALFYFFFYHRARKFDDRTGSVLHSDTPRGDFIKSLLLSFIFGIMVLDMIEHHAVQGSPMTPTSYAMMALILVLWVGSFIALNSGFFGRFLPRPVMRLFLCLFRPHWYRKFYKDDRDEKKKKPHS